MAAITPGVPSPQQQPLENVTHAPSQPNGLDLDDLFSISVIQQLGTSSPEPVLKGNTNANISALDSLLDTLVAEQKGKKLATAERNKTPAQVNNVATPIIKKNDGPPPMPPRPKDYIPKDQRQAAENNPSAQQAASPAPPASQNAMNETEELLQSLTKDNEAVLESGSSQVPKDVAAPSEEELKGIFKSLEEKNTADFPKADNPPLPSDRMDTRDDEGTPFDLMPPQTVHEILDDGGVPFDLMPPSTLKDAAPPPVAPPPEQELTAANDKTLTSTKTELPIIQVQDEVSPKSSPSTKESNAPTQEEKDLGFKAWRMFSKVMPRPLVKLACTLLISPQNLSTKEYPANLISELPSKLLAKLPSEKVATLDTGYVSKLSDNQLQALVTSTNILSFTAEQKRALSAEQLKVVAKAFIDASPVQNNQAGSTTYTFNSRQLAFFDTLINDKLEKSVTNKRDLRNRLNEKYPQGPTDKEFKVTVRAGITPNDLESRFDGIKKSNANNTFSIIETPFTRGDGSFLQNGADTETGGKYHTGLLALDELFAEEHPDAKRVHFMFNLANPASDVEANSSQNNLARTRLGAATPGGVSKALLFSDVEQVAEIDVTTEFNIPQKEGAPIKGTAYSHNYERLTPEDARNASKVLEAPRRNNIMYTTAPSTVVEIRNEKTGEVLYKNEQVRNISAVQVKDLMSTLLNNYAMVAEQHTVDTPPVIRGGHIGTGAFQNSVGLNALLQMVAAQKVGVNFVFHNFPAQEPGTTRLREAQEAFENGFDYNGNPMPPIKSMIENGSSWSQVENVILAAANKYGWQNGKDRVGAATD